MKKLVKYIPNAITSLRIIGAIILIFFKPFSLGFFICYAVTGLTDLFDGFLARKLHATSKLGTILDSVADIALYLVMIMKIMPTLIETFAIYHWIFILVPFVLHLSAYILCAFKFHKFSAIHTYLNKFQSTLIFFFPFSLINQVYWAYTIYMLVGSIFCTLSGIETLLIHITAKEYNVDNKTIFKVKENEREREAI